MTTATVANTSTTVTVDLIGDITVIAGPILATRTGTNVIIAATTVVMTGATTSVAMSVAIGVMTIGVIAVTTSATTAEMIDALIDIARMTIIATTIIGRNRLHRHHPKGAIPMAHSRRPTERLTSSLVVANDQKQQTQLINRQGDQAS
jgi:hypothetical protein